MENNWISVKESKEPPKEWPIAVLYDGNSPDIVKYYGKNKKGKLMFTPKRLFQSPNYWFALPPPPKTNEP